VNPFHGRADSLPLRAGCGFRQCAGGVPPGCRTPDGTSADGSSMRFRDHAARTAPRLARSLACGSRTLLQDRTKLEFAPEATDAFFCGYPAAAQRHRAEVFRRPADGRQITAICRLTGNGPQSRFVVTGEIRNPACPRNGGVEDSGAHQAMHDQILAAFPDLDPLVRLHLASAEGVPYSAVPNGWYWAGGSRAARQEPDAGVLERLLRLGAEDARRVTAGVSGGTMSLEDFEAFVETQKPRWKAEADAAATFLQTGVWPEPEPEAAAPAP